MKGEVEKVWKNETTDGRKYEVLQVDGEKYSLWDENYFDRFQEGQILEFDFRESGDFRNITKIHERSGDRGGEPEYNEQRVKRIIKMSCLRSASRVLVGSKIPYANRAEKTIEIAKKFEKYIDDGGFDEPGD